MLYMGFLFASLLLTALILSLDWHSRARFYWAVFMIFIGVGVPFWDLVPGKYSFSKRCAEEGGVRVFVEKGIYDGASDKRLSKYIGEWSEPDIFGIQKQSIQYKDTETGNVVAIAVSIHQYSGDLGFLKPWMNSKCFSDQSLNTKEINRLIQAGIHD